VGDSLLHQRHGVGCLLQFLTSALTHRAREDPDGDLSKLELIATLFKDVVLERLHLRIRLGELARSRGPSSLPYFYVASRRSCSSS